MNATLTFEKSSLLINIPKIEDSRGNLCVGNFGNEVPFIPKRFFMIRNVPSRQTRGGHAHKLCEQFLIAATGNIDVIIDNGHSRKKVILNNPHQGLYLPAMTWVVQYQCSSDAVLLVFASELYDEEDYIRDYKDFLIQVQKHP